MVDSNTVIEGTVKFRDGKKWKSRWCVMRKLSPVADCLHLQLYRDSKERYKQGQTKASLSLQHFLAIETGFTLDKESNTIAIICQDVTVILAFDTRERLMQWQVKISSNLGEDVQFLIQMSSAPPRAKIAAGPARLHVQEQRFCLTSGVPPRLLGFWDISQLRRYGVVEGRFVFEGGSRCGKGEGVHVCVTDQGDEITRTFQLAAQGKVATRRRPRNVSAASSPRRQRAPADVISAEALQQRLLAAAPPLAAGSCSGAADGTCCPLCQHDAAGLSRQPSAENLACHCRLHGAGDGDPQLWMSTETTPVGCGGGHLELDSNYGCGDAGSVSDLSSDQHYCWAGAGGGGAHTPAMGLDRCVSCMSKLGAMSRSSTATTYPNTPAQPFSPAWTMEAPAEQDEPLPPPPAAAAAAAAQSEYCVPRPRLLSPASGNAAPASAPAAAPPAATGAHPPQQTCRCCQCCPPKPAEGVELGASPPAAAAAPGVCKARLRPLPLVPTHLPQQPARRQCGCSVLRTTVAVIEHHHSAGGDPAALYDTPKALLLREECGETYDTPRQVRERLALPAADLYDVPAAARPAGCPCHRVLSWVRLPYCRRGSGVDHQAAQVPITRVPLSGQGKMPVVNQRGEIAIYATVDKSKKTNKRLREAVVSLTTQDAGAAVAVSSDEHQPPKADADVNNYVNVEGGVCQEDNTNGNTMVSGFDATNYENIDFAHSLEYYENSRDILAKVSQAAQSGDQMSGDSAVDDGVQSGLAAAGDGVVTFCSKCGHECPDTVGDDSENQTCDKLNPSAACDGKVAKPDIEDDYLMMEPSRNGRVTEGGNTLEAVKGTTNGSFPGYLPMSPITSVNSSSNKIETLKLQVDQNSANCASVEKSVSVPSLLTGEMDRCVRRCDFSCQRVVCGSTVTVVHHHQQVFHHHHHHGYHHSGDSLRRHLLTPGDEARHRGSFAQRKRSSSADSSRYLDEFDERDGGGERDRPISTSQSNFCIPTAHDEPLETPPVPPKNSALLLTKQPASGVVCVGGPEPECVLVSPLSGVVSVTSDPQEVLPKVHSAGRESRVVVEPAVEATECSAVESADSSSKESEAPAAAVPAAGLAPRVRRSSSLAQAAGNRDSSSSSDSGVSTCSSLLLVRPAAAATTTARDFELPLTTALSSRKHQHQQQRLLDQLAGDGGCLHASLPRRSKSVDPLRDISFQFHRARDPPKSTSAEAEVPVCLKNRGFQSPGGDSAIVVPYPDSRSTSSGTSDMSDYIETLSLSSHSSSDVTDSIRLGRQATTMLRPRSGKEYQPITQSILERDVALN